ncbi:MAG: HD domain-containing protein, partial [Prochlorothrix sp.]
MAQPIHDLLVLLATRGQTPYREVQVSHLEHALQCAALAKTQGASPSLIVAALLHDIGHLMPPAPTAKNRSVDLNHEIRSIAVLSPLFGPAVTEPIRLHVAAKR